MSSTITKKEYISKQDRKRFLIWVIKNYGYNVNAYEDLNKYNPQILSDRYYQETSIHIPKISIYRWICTNKRKYLNDIVEEIIDEYIR